MARTELITGIERRRRWSSEQKRALVSMAFSPGASVAEVARQADIHPNQIYRWRRAFCAPAGFAQVVVGDEVRAGSGSGSSIEIVIGADIQARIAACAPPLLAAAVVKALVGR